MNSVILLVVLILKTFAFDLINAKECVTPYNEKATCRKTSDCDVISSALFTLTPRAIQFYKDSQCGCDAGMVCCGTSNNKPYPPLINCTSVKQPIKIKLSRVSDRTICGLPSSTDMINGDGMVNAEEFPWLAALEYQNKQTKENAGIRCGGSIINKSFILTAAHCILDAEFEIIKVWVGVTNITSEETCSNNNGNLRCIKTVQKLNVERTIPHQFYNRIDKINDIGLLKLETDLQFSDYIRPICLPASDSELPTTGTHLTVAEWGATETGAVSQVKLKAELPLEDNEKCNNYLSKRFRSITSKQLCVGGERGKDACEGDSGGPLMYDSVDANYEVQWFQQGIVSYGTGCGVEGRPGVYTKVSSYDNWIFNKVTNRSTGLDKDEPCTTYNGTIGTCVPKKTCHEIFQMRLNKSEYYSYKSELEKQHCNMEDPFNAVVCCENPGSIISPNFNITPALPDKTTCGILKEKPGIVEDQADFPWIAGIEAFSSQDNTTEIRCIGTVINIRYVLTSISCILGEKDDTYEPINVWVGHWNNDCTKLNNCGTNPVQKIGIMQIIPYPFSTELFSNNLALILLASSIKFSDSIKPICLSSRNLPNLEQEETVTTVWLQNSTRTEPITTSELIFKQELPLTQCHNSNKPKPDGNRSFFCMTSKGEHNFFAVIPEGAPLMRSYANKRRRRTQWYLVSVINWNFENIGSVQFYNDSIIDYLDWIISIVYGSK